MFNPLLKKSGLAVLALLLGLLPVLAQAANGLPAFTSAPAPGGGQTYSLSIQTLMLMTAITFLPAVMLMMTAFTRIIIVLALLRQALGTMQTPPNQVLVGLSLFLTFFVMGPVFDQINNTALQPLMQNQIEMQEAMQRSVTPLRTFMLRQTRQDDLALFVRLSRSGPIQSPEATPLKVLVPAYVTSELKTAFQIGFLLFIPFLIIDMVVAAVLMSMGMMMLSPVTISLPFKLMLFVLVDGWNLVIGSLARSFYT